MIYESYARPFGEQYDPVVLAMLGASKHQFYLTGSHYFGCARPESDLDFMVQDTPEVREELRRGGFESLLEESDYEDDFGWTKGTNDVWQRDNIQVQLSPDVLRKRSVRDILCKHLGPQHKEANKEERAHLWGTLYEVLGFSPAAGIPL